MGDTAWWTVWCFSFFGLAMALFWWWEYRDHQLTHNNWKKANDDLQERLKSLRLMSDEYRTALDSLYGKDEAITLYLDIEAEFAHLERINFWDIEEYISRFSHKEPLKVHCTNIPWPPNGVPS